MWYYNNNLLSCSRTRLEKSSLHFLCIFIDWRIDQFHKYTHNGILSLKNKKTENLPTKDTKQSKQNAWTKEAQMTSSINHWVLEAQLAVVILVVVGHTMIMLIFIYHSKICWRCLAMLCNARIANALFFAQNTNFPVLSEEAKIPKEAQSINDFTHRSQADDCCITLFD